MKRKFWEDDETREYAKKQKTTKIRVLKHILKTGEEEYLITNIENLNYEELVEIYGKRWNIETLYYSLKSKLQIEKFTSSKEVIIKQDICKYISV